MVKLRVNGQEQSFDGDLLVFCLKQLSDTAQCTFAEYGVVRDSFAGHHC